METFIFEYHWYEEWVAEGTHCFSIEGKSKDDIHYRLLELCKEATDRGNKDKYYIPSVKLGYWDISPEILENSIEGRIYTIAEWTEKNKIKL